MPYVISDPCVGSKDQACVDVCPVDCIYEAEGRFWIQPDECTECGACESECPVEAIYYVDIESNDDDLREAREFFEQPLPGRGGPIGCPRGAQKIGKIATDHPRILTLLARQKDASKSTNRET